MSSSGIPEGLGGGLQSTGNMPAQAPTSQPSRDIAPNRQLPTEVDVAVETNLGEPIGSLASAAKSERESSLRSIEGVAEDIKDSKYYRSQVQNRASKNITKLFNPAAN